MTPETVTYLGKAREFVAKANDMLADDWPDEAGRAAYLAGMHAEFSRVAKDEPRFDTALRAFLGRTYNLKAITDYETGSGAQV